jgi:SNF family Na+-dependent transporter
MAHDTSKELSAHHKRFSWFSVFILILLLLLFFYLLTGGWQTLFNLIMGK